MPDPTPYEVFAIRYATVARRSAENFIGGDAHESGMEGLAGPLVRQGAILAMEQDGFRIDRATANELIGNVENRLELIDDRKGFAIEHDGADLKDHSGGLAAKRFDAFCGSLIVFDDEYFGAFCHSYPCSQ